MRIKRYLKIHLLIGGLIALMAAGCNSKSDNTTTGYTPSSSVAINSFSLKADTDVAEKLDSVYFSIDLDRAVIFNADSLPVGTDISALVTNISAASTASAVKINMEGGNRRTGTVDYLTSPTEAIDFTGNVSIEVTSQDGSYSRSYKVKVNVHKENPGKMLWNNLDNATLPSRLPNPANQKTVSLEGKCLSLIEEADGSYTIAETSDIEKLLWTKSELILPFRVNVRSLTASSDALYILSENGDLYRSEDGFDWSATGKVWSAIIGGYGAGLTGLRVDNGKYIHCYWPETLCAETPAEAGFPVSGMTNSGQINTDWSPYPTLIIYGGRLADNSLTSAAWGFDGLSWVRFNGSHGPALENAVMVGYWFAAKTSTMWKYDDRDTWMIIGGRLADGSPNREIWYTLDNGVNWLKGNKEMEIPSPITSLTDLDAFVSLIPMSASATSWQKKTHRLNTTIDGTTILWDCPEIYLFGGRGNSSAAPLSNTIWRTALSRFTFKPLI